MRGPYGYVRNVRALMVRGVRPDTFGSLPSVPRARLFASPDRCRGREMKVVVEVIWRTRHEIEVPDDWVMPATLDGFPEDALDQMTSANAELIDWG